MHTRLNTSLFSAVLSLFLLVAFAVCPRLATAADIRVLIDISGSMKHNDPHKLRAPALRLLTSLLPDGSHAGVWTYGQSVNRLVSHASVDASWKERAQNASAQINSAGLSTNIEAALDQASEQWQPGTAAGERHIIMLTDGLVDVGKDPKLNAASRDRIVNQILPRLREAKVKVHTVALSKDADHVLLRQLAAATDGWYEQVENADALPRVFLRIFEKAAKPDALPIRDNLVQVDASIEEMTFLVFREADKQIELITPGKQTISAAQTPPSTRWHRDTGYDLVTVAKPEAGAWQIRGTQDMDNRVMAVTNLKVRATELPDNIYLDDSPYYFVQLTQQGTVIRDKAFLDLVKITLGVGDGQNQHDVRLLDDGKAPDIGAGDGTFSYRLATPLKEGRHELSLLVDGTTFQREQRQVINVFSQPAAATVTVDPADSSHFILAVVPYPGLIDSQTMQVTAVITKPDTQTLQVALAQHGPAEWRHDMHVSDLQSDHIAEFTVQGMRPDGKPINQKLDRISFGAAGVKVIPETAPASSAAVHAEQLTAAPAEESHAAAEAAPKPEAAAEMEHINWLSVAWQSLLINAILIPIGYFAYRKWRRIQQPVIIAPAQEPE